MGEAKRDHSGAFALDFAFSKYSFFLFFVVLWVLFCDPQSSLCPPCLPVGRCVRLVPSMTVLDFLGVAEMTLFSYIVTLIIIPVIWKKKERYTYGTSV